MGESRQRCRVRQVAWNPPAGCRCLYKEKASQTRERKPQQTTNDYNNDEHNT